MHRVEKVEGIAHPFFGTAFPSVIQPDQRQRKNRKALDGYWKQENHDRLAWEQGEVDEKHPQKLINQPFCARTASRGEMKQQHSHHPRRAVIGAKQGGGQRADSG